MTKKKLIPFKVMPASWGLKGKSFERAKIEYELTGYEKDVALTNLDYSGKELEKKLLELKASTGIISAYEMEVNVAKIELEGKELEKKLLEIDKKAKVIDLKDFERQYKKIDCETEQEKALVDLEQDFKYNEITEKAYTKQKATLLNQPWVDVLGIDFDPKNPTAGGAFSLDWNDAFVEELRKNGYQGINEGQIVDRWFDTLCTQIAIESGLYKDNLDDQPVIRNTKLDDGRTEYS